MLTSSFKYKKKTPEKTLKNKKEKDKNDEKHKKEKKKKTRCETYKEMARKIISAKK